MVGPLIERIGDRPARLSQFPLTLALSHGGERG